ncbi:MAG: hypothetical protein O2816_01535 [Planctomycetota bacterium]|nr:hypothetical protein [Planctomycetota bacterium]
MANINLDRLQFPLRSGRTSFRIQFGSAERFFTHPWHEGCRPVAESQVLSLEWTPVVVKRSPEVDEKVWSTLDALWERPVRFEGRMDRIVELGMPAVPFLLEELERPTASLHRRAVVLGALHRITGLLDPRDWAREGPGPLGAFRGPGHSGSDGGPSRVAQEWYLERWAVACELVLVE